MSTNTELLDLISALEKEHIEVRDALDTIDKAIDTDNPAALKDALENGVPVLTEGLDGHSTAEDDSLYPAIADLLGQGLVDAFVDEHDRIRSLRNQIYGAINRVKADFGASGEFSELLRSHIDREEMMLFPSARDFLA